MFENPQQCVEKREKCVVCGAVSSAVLAQLSYSSPIMQGYWDELGILHDHLNPLTKEFPYRVEQCNQCGLVFQTYVLRPECEEILYRDVEETYFPGIRTQKWDAKGKFKFYAKTVELASAVFVMMQNKSPEEIKVLDFGAGWGYFSKAAQALGYEVEAAEINPSKRRHLNSLGISTIEFPPERKYDFVFADQVFEHLQNPVAFLKTLASGIGEQGGYILIGVPTFDGNGLAERFAVGDPKTIWVFSPYYHINMYTRNALQELGRRAGLTPVDFDPLLKVDLYRLEEKPLSKAKIRVKEMMKTMIKQAKPDSSRIFNGLQMFSVS